MNLQDKKELAIKKGFSLDPKVGDWLNPEKGTGFYNEDNEWQLFSRWNPKINTEKQERVKKIIDDLKKYINTYVKQHGYLDYSDETIINDMLYGIGIATDKSKYQFNNGFNDFKKYLTENIIKI